MSAAAAPAQSLRNFWYLVKREVIEHRSGVIYTPLAIAGLIALAVLVSAVLSGDGLTIQMDGADTAEIERLAQGELTDEEHDKLRAVFAAAATVFSVPVYLVSLVVAFFLVLGSLYDERAERTILFWKSMPVSDTQTVLSKLVTGLLVTPLVALLVTMVLQLFVILVVSVTAEFNDIPVGGLIWSHTPFVPLWISLFNLFVLYALWALPVYGWLLLASVLAPRAPFLFALLPVAVIAVIEGLFLRSAEFITAFGERLGGTKVMELAGQGMERLSAGDVDVVFSRLKLGFAEYGRAASELDFWIGLAIGIGLIAAAIQVRRRKTL